MDVRREGGCFVLEVGTFNETNLAGTG